MASYDSILETTAVRVIVDDARVKSQLNKVRQEAQKTYTALSKSQKQSARSSQELTTAQERASRAIKDGARFALTLRRELENNVISEREFRQQAEALTRQMRQQGTQFGRNTKEYDRSQLAVQRLSTALATLDGRTSKLGISANVATGTFAAMQRRLRGLGPAGSAAAAGLTAFSGAAGLAGRAARSFGRYIGTQLIPILATFAGIAGIGIATRALNRFVKASFDAEIAFRLFNREVQQSGQSLQVGANTLRRLADEFRTTEDAVAKAGVQLLRYGATVEQTEALLRAGGASALAFGRTTSAGFEAIAQAIVGERSQILNQIGIAGNLSTAFVRYGRAVGKTSDELTRQEKVQAALNLILEETQGEIEALEDLLDGYGGALSETQKQASLTARALGDEFRPAITQVLEATALFLEVFRTQVIPVLRDQFAPVIEGATTNIRDFLEVMRDPNGDIGALADKLEESIGGVFRLGAAFTAVGSSISAITNTVIAGWAGVGASIGVVVSQIEQFVSSGIGEFAARGLAGQERLKSGDVIGGYREMFSAFGELGDINFDAFNGQIFSDIVMEAMAPALARAEADVARREAAVSAYLNPSGAIEDFLARFQLGETPAPTPPSGTGAPGSPDAPGTPGGAGTPSDFNLLTGSAQGFTRAELEVRRLTAQVLAAGFRSAREDLLSSQAGFERLAQVGRGSATRASLVDAQAARQTALERNAFASGRRIADSLASATARGIAEEAAATDRAVATAGLAAFQDSANRLAQVGRGVTVRRQEAESAREAADGLERARVALENLAAAGRDAANSLPTARDRQDAVLGVLFNVSRSAGGYGTGATLTGRDVNFPTPTPNLAEGVFARRARGDGGLGEAAAIVAAQQQAADQFANQVVNSAFQFTNSLVDSIRSGDIGKAFEGLLSAGGGILGSANLGTLPFLGGTIGIGGLLQGGLGILGSIFGGLFGGGSNESPAANSAQNRRNLSTLEINYTVNQQNELGMLNNPEIGQRLAEMNEESFRRFEDILRRSILPDISALKERTGLA